MESRMDHFREFVNKHPLLRDEVRNGKRTWQNIYEEWVLYGDNDPQWQNYSNQQIAQQSVASDNTVDSIKNIVGYIQKINPDTITRTLNTVQKVVQIMQTLGGNPNRKMLPTNPVMPSMYNDWWD